MSREGMVIDNLLKGDGVFKNKVMAEYFQTRNGNGKFVRMDFNQPVQFAAKATPFAAPTGSTGDENVMIYPDGSLEWHVLGTQTILAPAPAATGLNIGMDQTANDGIEVCAGLLANNKLAFVAGTSPAFYAKMVFSQADVSGQDECAFGFRKAEAYQATLDGYDAMAVLNDISGDINIETIDDGATNVTTDTTDNFADGETHEFGVFVDADGAVTYTIDGRAPTVLPTIDFSFSASEVVVPFFYYLHDATSPGAIILESFECGLQ